MLTDALNLITDYNKKLLSVLLILLILYTGIKFILLSIIITVTNIIIKQNYKRLKKDFK